jgi:flagellar basal body rod protein FlgC
MEIGVPAAPTLFAPTSTALTGMADAQARVQDGAVQIAAGNVDPAVVVDISSAQIDFAANVKVLQAGQENTKRLLDMLA